MVVYNLQCAEDGSLSDLSVDDIVDSLQSRYPEYTRRKRNSFRNLVEKSMILCSCRSDL